MSDQPQLPAPHFALAFAPSADGLAQGALGPGGAVVRSIPAEVSAVLESAATCALSNAAHATAEIERAVAMVKAEATAPAVYAATLLRAAQVSYLARRPDSAFAHALEAQPLFEALGDRTAVAALLRLRGNCCSSVQEQQLARELLADAAKKFEGLGETRELGECHHALGFACLRAGELEQAIAHALQAIALAGDASCDKTMVWRNNLAYYRYCQARRAADEGLATQARAQLEQARADLPDLGALDGSRWIAHGAAMFDAEIQICVALQDLGSARAALARLAMWVRRWRSPYESGLFWLRRADYRVVQGRLPEAAACALRAARALDRVPLEADRLVAHRLRADLLEKLGDLPGAYEALVRAQRVQSDQQNELVTLRAQLLATDLLADQELRKAEQTLAYAQRLSNVGHMVSSINHELNQPMASIQLLAETSLELIERGGEIDAELRANLDAMLKLSTRLTELTTSLAAFPAQARTEPSRLAVSGLVQEALHTLRARLIQQPQGLIELQLCEGAYILGHETQIVRVLVNLLNNALDAVAGRPASRILVSAVIDDQHVTVTVADNGPGLAGPLREKLFQPFFTTKQAGHGLGLGLALSRDLIREMSGDLSIGETALGGAAFVITLPAAA